MVSQQRLTFSGATCLRTERGPTCARTVGGPSQALHRERHEADVFAAQTLVLAACWHCWAVLPYCDNAFLLLGR